LRDQIRSKFAALQPSPRRNTRPGMGLTLPLQHQPCGMVQPTQFTNASLAFALFHAIAPTSTETRSI